jgi:predicted protein tyrosine phosphatase
MNITIMNRYSAIQYCEKQHEQKSAIISISTPYGEYINDPPFVSQTNNVQDILYLSFADADAPNTLDVYDRLVTEEQLLTDTDAKRIVEFVKKNIDYSIIVHCDAGISRSSAVGAAILKYYIGDDSSIFDSPRYFPNMWCYKKILNAFYETNNRESI